MDFDQYVAARYGRLIEHAVQLGCAEDEAGRYVDQVLVEERSAIQRTEDPDPLLHEALDRAIRGTPDKGRRIAPFVALGLVVAAAGVGAFLTYRPSPEPMPSLFALNRAQAEQLLEERGYDVVFTTVLACEPEGLVLAADPIPGTPVRHGATVTVRTAEPSDAVCETGRTARSEAWLFVGFAVGGPMPLFAERVAVTVDNGEVVALTRDDAADRDRWGRAMSTITDSARATVPTRSGMPRLYASEMLPDLWCGDSQQRESDREVLRIVIDPRANGDERGCPLTVDLYRDELGVIDAVVVHTPKDLHDDATS